MPETPCLEAIVEAILLVATDPVDIDTFVKVIGCTSQEVLAALDNLSSSYSEPRCGFTLGKIEDGYRFYSKEMCYDYLAKFSNEVNESRLSGAALETLAIVAYQQPISRSAVSIIRGVNSDQVIRLLAVKGYISPTGRDTGPGSAQLFSTTSKFLDKLGINSILDLPSLAEFAPGIEVAEAFEISLREDAR